MTSGDDETLAATSTGARSASFEGPEPALGTVFAGRYEIEAPLGRGGMGSVYRVRDTKLDEVVALKLLTLQTEQAEDRFVSEVRLARRVTHPNVARTHDFGEDGPFRFLTMEYVPGTTLERIIEQRGPLSSADVVTFAQPIAAGLAAAHAAGVVHRDLKPANVLVGEAQRVVLTDFGIARAAEHDGGTHSGMMMGTPYYMSPEQVMGKPADARSDLYALGLIMYELATGTRPFISDNPMGSALARLHSCPVDPRRDHVVDDGLASLILRCLAREAHGRPASADAILERLRAVGSSASTDPTPEPRPTTETTSTPFAPLAEGGRTVVVLPFAFRGASEHAYLGEAMAEELIDVLSRTKGLRVLSLGATRRFAETRDPARIGEELGAESIVDGTVQHAAARVRLSVRMIDPDGTQRWAERYEGGLEDVFELQESLARRVAEALRIELDVVTHGVAAPPEAIEHYLRARRLQRTMPLLGAEEAVGLLDRALGAAPGLTPALAAHAMASVRAWWGYEDWERSAARAERAHRSVLRAQRQAPSMAETHLATAMWEVQGGGFIAGVEALSRALELAPTMPEVHQYLGQLQCEAGRPKEGRRRLEHALALDPSLHLCRYTLARVAMLHGDPERAYEHVDHLWHSLPGPPVPVMIMALRLSLYAGDLERAEMYRQHIAGAGGSGVVVSELFGVGLGKTSIERAESLYQRAHGPQTNTRFTTLMRQIAVELFTRIGRTDLALRELTTAADSALIDVLWLERCSLLDPLRGDSTFLRAEQQVRRRAAALWKNTPS